MAAMLRTLTYTIKGPQTPNSVGVDNREADHLHGSRDGPGEANNLAYPKQETDLGLMMDTSPDH